MLFHKIGIISMINYFCELVIIVLNEGLLSLKKKGCLPVTNCFVGVTKKQTLPHIRL
jgi:hypothetical protein